jgi:hypothetical protein
MTLVKLLITSAILIISQPLWAEGWSIGANLGFINSDQKDINSEISALNSTTGASEFGNAWEFNGAIAYRMSGSTAIMLRPSYFMYSEESGTGAKYNLTGFTIFPMLRWYMLEDATIHFYSQFGVGYGRLTGEIEETGMNVEFSGGSIGYMAGLGAEFCFGSHCINIEGSMRFLDIERMTVDSSSGAAPGGSELTQISKGSEIEISNRDLSTTMSGILGMVGYTLYF